MISPLPSYDDELLNSAYANISLIADKIWTYNPEDPFRKLNHSLWIQSCEVIAKYQENSDYRPRLVRDVISESRLAKYGNYEYDEQYEGMYRPDDGKSSDSGLRHFRSTMEAVEPWMLPEVQEHFARLISPNCTRSHREPLVRLSTSISISHINSMFNMQSSAIPILKCNTVRRENEISCSSFKSNWNEKKRQKISPKKSKKVGLHNELLPIHKSETNNGSHEKSIEIFARYRRYTIETAAEMQLESRIGSDAVRDIWNSEKFQQQQQQHRQNYQQIARQAQPAVQHHQQQFYCTLQYQPLILRTEYQRRMLQSPPPPPPPPPVLSAEVPEFFPKSSLPSITTYNINNKEHRAYQIRYFPSLNDRNYQSELFPYNRPQQEIAATVFPNTRMSILPVTETNMFHSPQEWIQRVAPPVQLQLTASSSSSLPICTSLRSIHDATIVHRPLQIYEKFLPCTQPSPTTSIPVYQRPMELYQEPTPKRKSQGVDFNNLILLTKNNVKTRRSKGTAQQSFLLESKQGPRTSGRNEQLQWFDKDRCTRGEVVTVNALVSELRSFEEKYECCKGAGTSWRTAVEGQQRSSETSRSRNKAFGSDSSRCRTSNAEERKRRTKRPLYRDVLANTSSGAALENVFEERYDELEQQAMEQYRNSEESLALKYQELERQAMEQYGNNSAGDEKRSVPSENQDCFDGQRCSGYGQCSPSRGRPERKGSSFPQITLLKPKGKSLPNVFRGSSCNDNNQQPAIASRSLSTLTDWPSKESKNICKGASGDKIDTSVSLRASSKRHLILMSPFERKSEARRIMKTTDLRGICSVSKTRRNMFGYYRTSEIARNGSGDENITIIQSPSTEVWLSGFWTT
ncbi:uncharacterized protein LOC105251130 [Camponotus floridanus]|nr:uncharacterized protein LOC105251130 [Camponotus floridanus]